MTGAPAIAAILFDKDGTLLDYRRSWTPINLAAATLAAAGDPALRDRLLAAGGADLTTGEVAPDTVLAAGSAAEIAAVWAARGSVLAVAELTAALDDLFAQSVHAVVPVAPLAPLFARLAARGLRLGIASSDGEAAIRRTAERFGLTPHLDFVAGYDSGFGGKPGPGMLLAFCAAVRVAPAAVAVVGDNAHDMAMAAAGGAGLRIGVLTGTGTRDTLAAADACLTSIADLEAFLAGKRT